MSYFLWLITRTKASLYLPCRFLYIYATSSLHFSLFITNLQSKHYHLLPELNILSTRGVHGSGRVRFVPNPDSTRSGRVEENQTRNRPPITTGRVGSDYKKRSVGSVETDERQRQRRRTNHRRIWSEESETLPIRA